MEKIVKKIFSGDHDQVAPRHPRTGSLIHPGALTDEQRATWEQDTNTLLPEGVAGPMLPEQAGYADAAVRMSNRLKHRYTILDPKYDYGRGSIPDEDIQASYKGDWMRGSSGEKPAYYDSESSLLGLPTEGDYRIGGMEKIRSYDDSMLGRRTYSYSLESARMYSKGAKKYDSDNRNR